ncbi:MAG TPA: hypothetical protein VF272_01315 [Candidatus Saccharimonadia bacterium]
MRPILADLVLVDCRWYRPLAATVAGLAAAAEAGGTVMVTTIKAEHVMMTASAITAVSSRVKRFFSVNIRGIPPTPRWLPYVKTRRRVTKGDA